MEAVKFKICRVGIQTKDPSKNWYCSLSSKAFSRWNSLWLRRDWKWKWSCSVLTDSLQPHGLKPVKLLCPWDFPGKNIGVGCHFLLRWQTKTRKRSKVKTDWEWWWLHRGLVKMKNGKGRKMRAEGRKNFRGGDPVKGKTPSKHWFKGRSGLACWEQRRRTMMCRQPCEVWGQGVVGHFLEAQTEVVALYRMTWNTKFKLPQMNTSTFRGKKGKLQVIWTGT